MQFFTVLIVLVTLNFGALAKNEVAQQTEYPTFFLSSINDSRCYNGYSFVTCSADTLFYVSGKNGAFQVHKRPATGTSKELCMSLGKVNQTFPEGSSSPTLPVKLAKCTHAGAKMWDISGDDTSGYLLHAEGYTKCFKRDPTTDVGLLVPCPVPNSPPSPETQLPPLNLQFVSLPTITAMKTPSSLLTASAASGDLKNVKRQLKDDKTLLNKKDWDLVTPLLAASAEGHLDVVKFLVKEKAVLSTMDKDGLSPVHRAAVAGHLDVLKFLVEKAGMDTDKAVLGSDSSPLWLAASGGRTKVLEYLIKAGGDVDQKRIDGMTPLIAAVIGNHPLTVALLIKHGADPNISDNENISPLINAAEAASPDILKILAPLVSDLNQVSDTMYTALVVASAANKYENVKVLLEAGADVNQILGDSEKGEGVTALMYAASSAEFPLIKLLVEGGADVKIRHKEGGSTLMEAASNGRLEVLKYFIEHGGLYNDHDDDNVTTLMSSSAQGNYECVEYLLSLSKKAGTLATWINQYSDSGGTPVMFAAGGGNKEIIQLLIDNGADVSLRVKAEPAYLDKMAKMIAEGHSPEEHTDGITALHVAATGGKFEACKVLIKNGVDVVAVDDEGKAALSEAIKFNHGDIAMLLIKHGADPNELYIDEEGNPHNLLMDSIIVENEEFAEALLSKNAKIDHVDESGVTVLIQAAHRGMINIVETLLIKNDLTLDVNAANNEGITALIAASSEGHSEIIELLLKSKVAVQVDAVDTDGTTALMAAAVRGHAGVVKSLLTAKANVDKQNVDGHTALMFAYNGKTQVETLWDRYGKDLSETEVDFLLVQEALKNHTTTVEVLVKGGANVLIKDKEGHVASDFDYHPEVDEEVLEKEKVSEKKRRRSTKEL